uniref:von Willebrand factor D and EGF domain-containing protein-like n=1 Tax=Saccoglossus kowalevskii TaxID=10224 RepID=A0ABM0M5T8_SACKO|nr:PREDICTED: von Willebrand factor D and EGF domain-containing protein-like [Saccoglossus kowalevskii]
MNCGEFNVYYLEPLDDCQAAYCKDLEPCPPGHVSTNGVQPGCSDNYPKIESDPTIKAFYNETSGYAYLLCSIHGESNASIIHTTHWIVNNEVVKETTLTDGDTDDTLDEDIYTLGSKVKCLVSSKYYGSDIASPPRESQEQGIEIIIDPPYVTVSEDQQLPSHVYVRASVPMSCTIRVKTQKVFQGRSEVVFSSCLLNIEYDTFDRFLNVEIDAVRDFQQDGDHILTVYFEPIGNCSVNVEPGYNETVPVIIALLFYIHTSLYLESDESVD